MDLKILPKPDYTRELTDKKTHIRILYYTKKQMKTIYPYRNYIIAGEIGNRTGVQIGTILNLDDQYLPIYKEKTHSRFTEGVAGFVHVDGNIYLAVVKNMLFKRALALSLIIVLVLCGYIFTKSTAA
jgi:hypothetical protein